MKDEEFDWNKHMKVFTEEVSVKVQKNVTREDVILSLVKDDEIVFKIKDQGHFILGLNKNWAKKEVLDVLIIDPIKKRAKELRDASQSKGETKEGYISGVHSKQSKGEKDENRI